MPTSKDLPSPMCPSCKFYVFTASSSHGHNCKDSGNFTNSSKIGKSPPGQTCKTFRPK